MATLGDTTNPPSAGSWYDVTTNKQYWNSATYTMPGGGGSLTDMYCYCGGNGTSTTGQLVIWSVTAGGAILWQSGNITIPASNTQVHVGGITGVYIAGGTGLKLGFWAAGAVSWEFDSSGGVYERSGVSSPAAESGTADEYAGAGHGYLGVYIAYTPGGVAHVNTGTPASPTWVTGVVSVNTGTPASPIWTPATNVAVNTGTPASPVWTPAT